MFDLLGEALIMGHSGSMFNECLIEEHNVGGAVAVIATITASGRTARNPPILP